MTGVQTCALPIYMALKKGLENLSLLTAFKLVPPALSALLADPELADRKSVV